MEQLAGRLAVVTGGATGIGRELVVQLAAAGCHVATCDVVDGALGDTRAAALAAAPEGVVVTAHVADVAEWASVAALRDEVATAHGADRVHLLFNNAGIAGAGSFVVDDPAAWERVFDVDWGGVYRVTRTFLPLLLNAEEGHVVNVSSVNGLWASVGPSRPHTAYSAAKFAVRGFTEALQADFALNAPHLRASVVLPGHVGTSIVLNAVAGPGNEPAAMDDAALERVRRQAAGFGVDAASFSDDELRATVQLLGEAYRDAAPTTAASAASTILRGVRENRWRILVGEDARVLDQLVREDPEGAYSPAFYDRLGATGMFTLLVG